MYSCNSHMTHLVEEKTDPGLCVWIVLVGRSVQYH